MCSIILLRSIVFMIFILQLVACQNVDNIFKDFLTRTMSNFPRWAGQSNLDPTLPDTATPDILLDITNTLYKLNGTIGSISVAGLSGKSNIFDSASYFRSGKIGMQSRMACANLTGKYNLSGSVLNTYPVSGVGSWHIEACQTEILIDIDFSIKNGFIVLGQNNLYAKEFFMRDKVQGEFVGLFSGGSRPYQNLVVTALADELGQKATNQNKRVFYPHIRKYLDHIFETTPVSEILLPVTARA